MSLINDALKRAGTVRALPAEHQGGVPMQPVAEEPSAGRSCGNPLTYGIVGFVALLVIVVAGLMLKSKTSHFQEPEPTFALATTASRETAPVSNAAFSAAPTPAQTVAETAPTPEMAPEPAAAVKVNTQAVTLPAPEDIVAQVQATPAPAEIPVVEAAPAVAETIPAAPLSVAQTTATPAAETTPPATPAAAEAALTPAPEPVVAAAVPAQFPDLQLQAIHYRLRNSSVMVNGKVVRVGESIAGARVTAIHRYGADVVWNGQKKFLALD